MKKKYHIVMFPWFAMGHILPYLHLANNLAKRGLKITFLLPQNTMPRVHSINHHPSLITLHPITVPHVAPLPPGAETTNDIPFHLTPHLATAFDLTRPQVNSAIADSMHVDFLFYDFAYWAPQIAAQFGIRTVSYNVVFSGMSAFIVPGYGPPGQMGPPPGYPNMRIVFHGDEIEKLKVFLGKEFGRGLSFYERSCKSKISCDALAFRTVKETEGIFCDYLATQYNKPVLLTGPNLPEFGPDNEKLGPKWASWLGQFGPRSVVYCAFGTEFNLTKDQFQELVLGLEMTELPFILAVKPPLGCATLEEALPDGFNASVGDRGVVHDGWVPQIQILAHESVGCFMSHCGYSSMWESLLSESQIVLVPHLLDQALNTRLLTQELKVGVEIVKESSNGWVSKENLCYTIKSVMDNESEIGNLIRKNHAQLREVLISPGFFSGYIDNFIKDLELLLD